MHSSIRSTRLIAVVAPRDVTDFQREQLYRLANLTLWTASRFNAWLHENHGAGNLDDVRSFRQAAAIIDDLRALTAAQP